MKKIYSLLFVLSYLSSSYAQVTITNDWFYSIGDTILTASYSPDYNRAPNEGIDITWDISDVIPDRENETIFLSPSELDYSSDFPDAYLGYKRSSGLEVYFKNDGERLSILGSRTPEYRITYENDLPIVGYNDFKFGDEERSEYVQKREILATMSISLTDLVNEFKYVGFGTVITPEGTYEDCVLTKLELSTSGSAIASIVYTFYKDHFSNPIASHREFLAVTSGPSKFIDYKINQLTTSTEELKEPDQNIIWANEHSIFIKALKEMELQLQIFNVSGALVFDQPTKILTGENEIKIDHLNRNNIYVLLAIDKATGAFKTLKFHR